MLYLAKCSIQSHSVLLLPAKVFNVIKGIIDSRRLAYIWKLHISSVEGVLQKLMIREMVLRDINMECTISFVKIVCRQFSYVGEEYNRDKSAL